MDWLHQPLGPDQVEEVEEALRENDGALFPDQLAVHVWGHASRKYLARLDPQVIRTENTRFNMMVRRFLD